MWIFCKGGVRVAFKPVRTLANIFRIPKTRPSEERTKAVVYKYECKSCSFSYIGESKICWCSRWLEHKPGVRKNIFSAIKDHAESTGHDAAKSDAVILEKGVTNNKLYTKDFSRSATFGDKQRHGQ